MVPSIIDVWGYDREVCSSSSSTNVIQKLKFCRNEDNHMQMCNPRMVKDTRSAILGCMRGVKVKYHDVIRQYHQKSAAIIGINSKLSTVHVHPIQVFEQENRKFRP